MCLITSDSSLIIFSSIYFNAKYKHFRDIPSDLKTIAKNTYKYGTIYLEYVTTMDSFWIHFYFYIA